MRILQLHCDSIEYTPTKKEIKSAEEIEPKKTRIKEVVVCFTAIEEDDDSSVAKNAIIDIQKSMKQIGCNKLLLYPYAHLSSNLASPGTGLKILKEMKNHPLELKQHMRHLDGQKLLVLKLKDTHLQKVPKFFLRIQLKKKHLQH